jgi:hypothetical protein
MEYQGSYLDTLPRRRIIPSRVNKRRVRHPPSPPIRLTIKTLDQEHLLRLQPALIVPSLTLVVPHIKRLASPVRVDERLDHQILFSHGGGLGDGERVAEDLADGTPDVDDLHAALEEALGLVGEVVGDTGECGLVGLVDVGAHRGPAEFRAPTGALLVAQGGVAADGVVKDEDLGRSGSVKGYFKSVMPPGALDGG